MRILAKKRMPKPGETWTMEIKDPWNTKFIRAKILDVRAGWVRYDMCPGMSDQRKKMDSFVGMYNP